MKSHVRSLRPPVGWIVGGFRTVALIQGLLFCFHVVANTQVPDVVTRYCVNCHDADVKKGGLDLETINRAAISKNSDAWEKVVRKLRVRQMPPLGKERPDERTYDAVVAELSSTLDRAAPTHPNPGRTETFRRLNRTEYQNAIRDLLALEIDATAILPKDDAGHGFDNVTVGDLSPMLLNRYITAAEKISHLAIGLPQRVPGGDTFRVQADLTQEEHIEGLPLGTRGGTSLTYTFPRDGTYEIQLRLTRDRNEEVEGLHESHDVVVLLDNKLVQRFTVTPPPAGDKDFEKVDAHLKARLTVPGGPHQLGITFPKKPSSLLETRRQPYQAHYNMHRHPRPTPALYQVSINGPYDSPGISETPSRRRIFINYPATPQEDDACAERILSALMRRAYRRPVAESDVRKPMEFYRNTRAENGFDAGIEAALTSILVSPEFLFRIERDPPDVKMDTAYHINDVDLASRLSFFLWSSIPDDELLTTAERGELNQPSVLKKQARRMLADARSQSLVNNFAGQWLHLRNLEAFTPDLRLFPDFDDNLRQAFRRETELHFETVMRDDLSVLELLTANYTFLNERLAKHYGIPYVYGSRFRRVALEKDCPRGGLLRQGSVLTVTSYANRTSPVIRGKWVLDNLLGALPPPPLPDVPALKDNTVSGNLSVRERLFEHRSNAACASCHNLMDPIGLSLENFDAIGGWHDTEDGCPINVAGGFADGSTFNGVSGLEDALRKRPELFVNALAEKLLTFALGRGIEPADGPALRKIVRDAQANDYRFSSIILGIADSVPFTMRKAL